MKKYFAIAVLLLVLLGVVGTLVPHSPAGPFDLAGFGRLPVLANGRLKPLDSIARSSLLMLQGRQSLRMENGRSVSPEEWLLEVFYRPDLADNYRIFRIDHPEVLSLFGLGADVTSGQVRFSFAQLQPGLPELERQAQLAGPIEAAARNAFQRAVVELREHLEYYSRLQYSAGAPGKFDLVADLASPARRTADASIFQSIDNFSLIRAIPAVGAEGAEGWQNVCRALSAVGAGTEVNPALRFYGTAGLAWREQQPEAFNAWVRIYRAYLAERYAADLHRCDLEYRFNEAEPFYTSSVLYVAALLLAVVSWLKWPAELGRAASGIMAMAFVLTTVGIAARMWLEHRPPVTNLYSSALFIGWGAVALCLLLERLNRNGVASAAGSLIGFSTLVIAHNLSLSGDTLEMMRAVLDSNFWLSTHVVTVTIGYASTFLAGFLGIIYILRGVLGRSLDSATADSLTRMVYGIVCFATFFSFVGTVLGGIWADQSWGSFWGWDPKENGALLIVMWNSIILHCRWGGLIRQRGLMAMAVGGNVVTAWSWFGTNMLGVGLHSYGFTAAAFEGLVAFVVAQLLIIGLAALPAARWRSSLQLAR